MKPVVRIGTPTLNINEIVRFRPDRYRTAVSDKTKEISIEQDLKRNPNFKNGEVHGIDWERQARIDEQPDKRTICLLPKLKKRGTTK